MATILIPLNELGRRFGQHHHRAILTDREVELLLQLREQGWGYKKLAKKFEISPKHAYRLCKGQQRNHRADHWKKVEV